MCALCGGERACRHVAGPLRMTSALRRLVSQGPGSASDMLIAMVWEGVNPFHPKRKSAGRRDQVELVHLLDRNVLGDFEFELVVFELLIQRQFNDGHSETVVVTRSLNDDSRGEWDVPVEVVVAV